MDAVSNEDTVLFQYRQIQVALALFAEDVRCPNRPLNNQLTQLPRTTHCERQMDCLVSPHIPFNCNVSPHIPFKSFKPVHPASWSTLLNAFCFMGHTAEGTCSSFACKQWVLDYKRNHRESMHGTATLGYCMVLMFEQDVELLMRVIGIHAVARREARQCV
jgi:hypothetical protein